MKKRMVIVFFMILSLFVGIIGRYAYLAGGREVAQYTGVYGSRSIRVGINMARGVMKDRNGKVLVGAVEQKAVLCEPMSLSEESAERLREHAVFISAQALDDAIADGRPFLAYVDEEIFGNGLVGITALRRYSGMAQNLIGYIDGDGHGVTGLESIFDEDLFREGYAYSVSFQADAARRALSGYGLAFEGRPVAQSEGIELSLDAEILEICEAVAPERGVVLVSDLRTGEICSWVSRPTYDAYNVADYLQSEDAMLNKALCTFSCGSVFKIIVAAAALEAGLDITQEYECTGAYTAGDIQISCSKKEGHGKVTGESAFCHSCNPYFCELAAQVGAQAVLDMARRFGLGESIDLGYGIKAQAGKLPTAADLSVPAALANFAIGQGSLQVTPVQVLQIASTVANKGIRPSLSIIKDEKTQEVSVLSPDTAGQLAQWMAMATRYGTGVKASTVHYSAAVKTSSAETGIYQNGKQVLHTWVTGFYPAEDPQYAITVLVEGGSSGYASAAPIFSQIADQMYGCGLIEPVL